MNEYRIVLTFDFNNMCVSLLMSKIHLSCSELITLAPIVKKQFGLLQTCEGKCYINVSMRILKKSLRK